jgi:uracil-DNA glycosylase
MKELNYILSCKKCSLHITRHSVVLGRGTLPCDVLYLGEAPGQSEDLLAKAFVGRAGKLLDELIIESKLNKFRSYFTNCILCHPTDKIGGANRLPTINEIASCMLNVNKIISVAKPKIIIFVGKTALTYYKKTYPHAFAIQHPSYLLRSGGKSSPHYIPTLRKLEEIYAIINS